MCQPDLAFANCLSNGRKRLIEKILFSLHWRGSLARGSSARRPVPHTGSKGLASAKRLLSAVSYTHLTLPTIYSV